MANVYPFVRMSDFRGYHLERAHFGTSSLLVEQADDTEWVLKEVTEHGYIKRTRFKGDDACKRCFVKYRKAFMRNLENVNR